MKHKALKPFFRASVTTEGVLELTVYEEIGENWWTGGGVTAMTVKQQLDAAGSFSSILIRINSPGGDAFEGIAIRSLLRSQNKTIRVIVDGIAASAASIVAMAGDSIQMASGSMMMIHDAWSMCVGKDEDMRQCADTLEKVSASIAQVYADRTGLSLDEVTALMDAESWLTAQECIEMKFADGMTADSAGDRALALAKSFKLLAKMKRTPEALRAVPARAKNSNGCECECDACAANDCPNCSMEGCSDEECFDCPMQPDTSNQATAAVQPQQQESNLSRYQAAVDLLRLKVPHRS